MYEAVEIPSATFESGQRIFHCEDGEIGTIKGVEHFVELAKIVGELSIV